MKSIHTIVVCWLGYFYTLCKASRMRGRIQQALTGIVHDILLITQRSLEMVGIYQWYTHSVWEVVDG